MKKIVVLTDNDGSSESGSVNYSGYLLVSSETLKFDEEVFTKEYILPSDIGIERDNEDGSVDSDELEEFLTSLGYTVERPGSKIIWAGNW